MVRRRDALGRIEEGVTAIGEAGGAFNLPMIYGLWAEALAEEGAKARARERLEEARSLSRSTGEVHSLPEIVRRCRQPPPP